MTSWRDNNSMHSQSVVTTPAVMVNGDIIFTVVGDIIVQNLMSECITANGVTASTLQYQSAPTGLAAVTISGTSASLASAAIGTVVSHDGTALSTAPNIYVNGTGLAQTSRGILVSEGTIKLVIGVGSTTGTWKHYLRYLPLEPGAYVS